MGVVRIRKSLSRWKKSLKVTVKCAHVYIVEFAAEGGAVLGIKRKERVFCVEANVCHNRPERPNKQITETLRTTKLIRQD